MLFLTDHLCHVKVLIFRCFIHSYNILINELISFFNEFINCLLNSINRMFNFSRFPQVLINFSKSTLEWLRICKFIHTLNQLIALSLICIINIFKDFNLDISHFLDSGYYLQGFLQHIFCIFCGQDLFLIIPLLLLIITI